MRQMQPGSSDFVITDPPYIARYARATVAALPMTKRALA
jgi:hypothetical protein